MFNLIALRRSMMASVALLGLAIPAMAQQKAPAPTTAAPAPAVSPLEPTPATLAIAREVIQLTGVAKSFETLIPQFLEQARASLGTTRPEISKDLGEVITQIGSDFNKNRDEMIDNAARVYARRLSEQELTDVLAFFKSASGQKYIVTQPQMLDELFAEMQAWTRQLSEAIVTRIRVEMKKRGHEI